MNIFALVDSFTDIVMWTLVDVMTDVIVGWVWKKEGMKAELTAEGGVDRATYPVIRFLLKWVCPVLVSLVFIFGIIDFIQSYNSPSESEAVVEESNLKVEGIDMEELENIDIESVTLTPVTAETDNN